MRIGRLTVIVNVLSLVLGMPLGANAAPTTFGPIPYTSFAANSPFNSVSFSYFFLENFDDHLLNTPGVSVTPAVVTSATLGFNGSIIDQVGLEGGCPLGGLSVPCDTLFGVGNPGFTFTFDAGVLGSLPTHAGVVWTDGAGDTSFQAFAADGLTVLCSVGPVSIADGSFSGTTADDNFFGCSDAGGIKKIVISNTSGGIEVDDLQYGAAATTSGPPSIPEPSTLLLLGSGLFGLVAVARRRDRRN